MPLLTSFRTHHLRSALLAAGLIAGLAGLTPVQPPVIADVHFHHLGDEATASSLAAMDSMGVRLAVVMGTPAQLRALPAHPRMQLVRALTLPCPGGRMPNSGVACYAGSAEWPSVDSVRAWVREGIVNMLGEINTQYAGIAPDDARLEPYFALAEELDLPVALHLGVGPPGVAYADSRFPPHKSPNYSGSAGDPLRLEPVLTRHPKMRLYVSHAAWPMRDAMLYMLYMHPRLYVDLSVLQYAIPRAAYTAYVRDLVDAGFASRLMFGSDGNARRVREGIAAIDSMPFLTDVQRRAILGESAWAFFKR
jgi:hypothetical protein